MMAFVVGRSFEFCQVLLNFNSGVFRILNILCASLGLKMKTGADCPFLLIS